MLHGQSDVLSTNVTRTEIDYKESSVSYVDDTEEKGVVTSVSYTHLDVYKRQD